MTVIEQTGTISMHPVKPTEALSSEVTEIVGQENKVAVNNEVSKPMKKRRKKK